MMGVWCIREQFYPFLSSEGLVWLCSPSPQPYRELLVVNKTRAKGYDWDLTLI